jgi:hypothetical protein
VHAEQFRKISASNETALRELRERAAAAQAEGAQEVEKLREELASAQREAADQRANSGNM